MAKQKNRLTTAYHHKPTLYLPCSLASRGKSIVETPISPSSYRAKSGKSYPIPFPVSTELTYPGAHYYYYYPAMPIAKPKSSRELPYSPTRMGRRDALGERTPGLRTPTPPRLAEPVLGKSRRRTAYPQQIVTTRLLYCLQDRFAQLSRLQRI